MCFAHVHVGLSQVSSLGNETWRDCLKNSLVSRAEKGIRLFAYVLAFFILSVSLCAGRGPRAPCRGAPPRLPALELPAGPRGCVTFRWCQLGLSFHRAVRLLLVGEIVQMMEQSDLSVKDAAVDTL